MSLGNGHIGIEDMIVDVPNVSSLLLTQVLDSPEVGYEACLAKTLVKHRKLER